MPTVIKVPFENDNIERFDFAVIDTTNNTFEPNLFVDTQLEKQTKITAQVPQVSRATPMVDGDINTYVEIPLPESNLGTVTITLTGKEIFTSSQLILTLDNHVSLPNTISLQAKIHEAYTTIIVEKALNSAKIFFPETTAKEWRITFNFGQPLRISELQLVQKDGDVISQPHLLFLALPEHSYTVYFNPDRTTQIITEESGNLINVQNTFIKNVETKNNENYIIADVDNDGIPDMHDNCVYEANEDQEDKNKNNIGDVCDDFDRDGIINIHDNCKNHPNKKQQDTDNDGIGDACDDEESRLTEKNPWLPWVGMGTAGIILIVLIYSAIKTKK